MYKSPADLLQISLEELMNLDEKGIIRLEKRLKAQQVQNNSEGYNPQQNDILLNQLKDEEAKKAIYFIEKHPNLKEFISTGKDNSIKTFSIDNELLANTPNLNTFLAPYLEDYMMQLVKRDFGKKKYDTILRAMEYKALFTESFLDTYYRFVINQLSIIIETINVTQTGKLCDKLPEITYVTFVRLLNTVPLGLIRSKKIDYINAMVDYYNKGKNRYREFPRVKRIFGNMRDLYFDDFEMKRFVKKLAAQITSVGSEHTETSSSNSGSSSKTVWGILVAVILIVRVISIASRSSNSYTPSYPSDYKIEQFEGSQVLLKHLMKTNNREGSKNAFFQGLIDQNKDEVPFDMNFLGMTDGSNPHPLYFNRFSQDSLKTQLVPFENKSEDVTILYALNQGLGQHRAGYYLGGSQTALSLSKGDSLVFYTGEFFGELPDRQKLTSLANKRPTRLFKYTNPRQRELLMSYFIIDSVTASSRIEITPEGPVLHHTPHHIELSGDEEGVVETVQ